MKYIFLRRLVFRLFDVADRGGGGSGGGCGGGCGGGGCGRVGGVCMQGGFQAFLLIIKEYD